MPTSCVVLETFWEAAVNRSRTLRFRCFRNITFLHVTGFSHVKDSRCRKQARICRRSAGLSNLVGRTVQVELLIITKYVILRTLRLMDMPRRQR